MNKGFTFMEMAIVFTILSLSLATIIGGKALVTQAKLKSVISDIQYFKTGIKTFRLEFKELPGDFGDPDLVWPGHTTLAGNEDNRLEAFAPGYENLNAWEHMDLAGILRGGYTGSRIGGGGAPDRGTLFPPTNVPTSRIKGGVYTLWHSNGGPFFAVNGREESRITLGRLTPGWPLLAEEPLFKPADAAAIDKKYDDGAPDTGELHGYGGIHFPLAFIGEPCTAAAATDGGPYNVTNEDEDCVLVFWLRDDTIPQ